MDHSELRYGGLLTPYYGAVRVSFLVSAPFETKLIGPWLLSWLQKSNPKMLPKTEYEVHDQTAEEEAASGLNLYKETISTRLGVSPGRVTNLAVLTDRVPWWAEPVAAAFRTGWMRGTVPDLSKDFAYHIQAGVAAWIEEDRSGEGSGGRWASVEGPSSKPTQSVQFLEKFRPRKEDEADVERWGDAVADPRVGERKRWFVENATPELAERFCDIAALTRKLRKKALQYGPANCALAWRSFCSSTGLSPSDLQAGGGPQLLPGGGAASSSSDSEGREAIEQELDDFEQFPRRIVVPDAVLPGVSPGAEAEEVQAKKKSVEEVPPASEKRRDPADGTVYTFAEVADYYEGDASMD
eukprot:g19244.t1